MKKIHCKTLLLTSLLIFFISACSCKPYALTSRSSDTNDTLHSIYISSHGWHTGLVVPAQELHKELPLLAKRFKDVKYYEIGWGDRDYYQANEVTTALTLQAVFWPTDSVVHVVSVNKNPIMYFSNSEVIQLRLSEGSLHTLNRFIASSFDHDANGTVIPLKKGIYGESQFYKGEGEFHLMNTCNTWTAKGLKSAGLPINPSFKLSANSVISFLKDQE